MRINNKIKVLHIIPDFGTGGAERLVVDLMDYADKKQFEVATVSLYPEKGTILEKEIRKKELKVYYLDKHLGLDLSMISKLYRLFCFFRPDIVHTHRYVLRYSLLPTIFCKIPVRVHTVHNIAQKEVDMAGKFVHKIAFCLAGVVPVSISKEVANTVQMLYGKRIKTPIIYNGVPTLKFSSTQKKNSGNNIILLHIGRFAPQKNHKLLIEAFSIAVKECSNLRLWLIGDGKLKADIESMVKKNKLEQYVSFLGALPNVNGLLKKCDVFILSSDWEGVPLAIIEAMASGKPVIATAVGGLPELVEDGVTGILVPPGDAKLLADAILRLTHHHELRLSMGIAGQKRAIEYFDITNCVRAYETLYHKLLEEKYKA